MRFALDHAEYAPVHHLEGIGLQVDQDKQEPIFRCRQGTVLVDSKPARGPRLPIHAPCRHLGVERRLEGRDQLLKLVERQAREIQELHRAGLQLGKPYTSHGSCLLSLSRDIRGASYQKESGINSVVPHCGLRQRLACPLPTKGDKGSYKKWKSVTPAMAAGLTDHVWTTDELLSFRVPPKSLW